jgi:hypothetical protein
MPATLPLAGLPMKGQPMDKPKPRPSGIICCSPLKEPAPRGKERTFRAQIPRNMTHKRVSFGRFGYWRKLDSTPAAPVAPYDLAKPVQ